MKLVLEARKKVISALVYPAVLVGLSVADDPGDDASTWCPSSPAFFGDLEVELPLLTRMMLGDLELPDQPLAGDRRWRWSSAVLGPAALGARPPAGAWRSTAASSALPLIGPRLQALRALRVHALARDAALRRHPAGPGARDRDPGGGQRLGAQRARPRPSSRCARARPSTPRSRPTGIFEPLEIDMVKVGEATGALDAHAGRGLGVPRRGRSRPAWRAC